MSCYRNIIWSARMITTAIRCHFALPLKVMLLYSLRASDIISGKFFSSSPLYAAIFSFLGFYSTLIWIVTIGRVRSEHATSSPARQKSQLLNVEYDALVSWSTPRDMKMFTNVFERTKREGESEDLDKQGSEFLMESEHGPRDFFQTPSRTRATFCPLSIEGRVSGEARQRRICVVWCMCVCTCVRTCVHTGPVFCDTEGKIFWELVGWEAWLWAYVGR